MSFMSAQQCVATLQASTMFQRHQKHFYVPDFPMQHKGLDLLAQMQHLPPGLACKAAMPIHTHLQMYSPSSTSSC